MPTSDFFSKFTPNRNENENSMHRVSNETHLPLVGLCDHSRYLSISYALHVETIKSQELIISDNGC